MLTDVCVSLLDVLEVRGSVLTEPEAWALLLQIGRILGESPNGCSGTPDDIQIHPNGSVSLNPPGNHKESLLHQDYDNDSEENQNYTVHSINKTILWALHYGNQDHDIKTSTELQSVLCSKLSHPNNLHDCIMEAYEKYQVSAGDDLTNNSPETRLVKMYESVLGSSFMDELHSELKNSRLLASKYRPTCQSRSQDVALQTETDDFMSLVKEKLTGNEELPLRTPLRRSARIHGRVVEDEPNEVQNNHEKTPARSHTLHRSLLTSKSSPTKLQLLPNGKLPRDALKVEVEFVDGRRVIATLSMQKSSCGLLCESCVNCLVGSVDSSLFGLAVFKDSEYMFLNLENKLNSVMSMYGITSEPRFYLRLRFVPRDFQSDRNQDLLHAIYLQTRKDMQEGRMLCQPDHAVHVAAYAMQYELGDFEGPQDYFKVEDFVPPGILERIGKKHVKHQVQHLHSKLRGMSTNVVRELYLCKAREIADFGAHFYCIYWSKKCRTQSAAWLGISHQGVYMFDVQQCNSRKKIHSFAWEQLKKIGFKNTSISLSTNDGTKVKFHVKYSYKSKYLVEKMGVMHQFYKFEDFQCSSSLHSFVERDPQNFLQSTDNNNTEKRVENGKLPEVIMLSSLNRSYSSGRNSRTNSFLRNVNSNERNDDPAHYDIVDETDVDSKVDSILQDEKEQTDDLRETNGNSFPRTWEEHDDAEFQEETSASFNDTNISEITSIPGSYRVELEKLNGTFGFSIMGGSDKPTGFIKVQQIVEGGAAAMNGNLHKGDIILGINDQSLCGVTHKKSVEIFSKAPSKSVLIVQRGNSDTEIDPEPSLTSDENEIVPFDQLEEFDDNIESLSHPNANDLDKNEDESLLALCPKVPEEFDDKIERSDTYDDRVLQVASAFYNQDYTDIQSDFQHFYIGSGGEDVSFQVGSDYSHPEQINETPPHEDVTSRGEGDGVSNLSAQDHKISPRNSERSVKSKEIPRDTSDTIADFEDFTHRLQLLKKANDSSDYSEDNTSWSTSHD